MGRVFVWRRQGVPTGSGQHGFNFSCMASGQPAVDVCARHGGLQCFYDMGQAMLTSAVADPAPEHWP